MAKKREREDAKYLAEVLDDVQDVIPAADEIDREESPFLLRIINGATMLLAVMLIGASTVFWWVVLSAIINDPGSLNDLAQMRLILILCTAVPIAIFIVQTFLKRELSIENWLKCMCLSGVIAAAFTAIFGGGVDFSGGAGNAFSELLVLLCCGIAGCALPAMLCSGVKYIFSHMDSKRLRRAFHQFDLGDENDAREWELVRRDVMALTDFDKLLSKKGE